MSERKFTVLHLEFRKLTAIDWLYVSGFAILTGIYLFLEHTSSSKAFPFGIYLCFLLAFHTVSSPFGLRFRNVWFSSIWVFISLILMSGSHPIGNFPLFTFLLYHVLRLVFWKIYCREWIPFMIGKGQWSRHRSKFEGRAGNKKDKLFTEILLGLGLVSMVVLVVLAAR